MLAYRAVTPLAIIVGAPGPRAATALTLAAAAAALGRPVAMLFDGAGVAALAEPGLATALELGVRVIACQTGMAEAGISAAGLPHGVETGGMVGFLAQTGDAQLLLA